MPAGFNHGLDDRSGTGKNGFDGSVTAVTNPTAQSALHRLIFDKGTVPDPLHPPPHHDMTHDIVTHARSPGRWPAPVYRDLDQRSTERM